LRVTVEEAIDLATDCVVDCHHWEVGIPLEGGGIPGIFECPHSEFFDPIKHKEDIPIRLAFAQRYSEGVRIISKELAARRDLN
jgi:hypothetical protein